MVRITLTLAYILSVFFSPQLKAGSLQQNTGITLNGTTIDLAVEKAVSAHVTLYSKEKLLARVETDPAGKFRFNLPPSTTRIVFASEGFRPHELPVSFISTGVKGDFSIEVPLIRSSKPCVPSASTKENSPLSAKRNIAFKAGDIFTNELLDAEICIRQGSLNRCFEAGGQPATSGLDADKPVQVTVKAKGYQTAVENVCLAEESTYVIRLMPVLSALCASYDGPLDGNRWYRFYHTKSKLDQIHFNSKEKSPATKLSNHFETGDYEYTVHDVVSYLDNGQGRQLREVSSEIIGFNEGLNFMELPARAEQPTGADKADVGEASHPESKGAVSIASIKPFDSTSIFFPKSDYLLPVSSRLRLDSVLMYLKSNDALTVLLTGHTENIGNRDLNLTLSEYRAKVVASYLKNNGVAENRIQMNWVGPDFLLTSGKGYQGSNQRVEMRIK